MKRIEWWEVGGAAAGGALIEFVSAGKVPALQNVPDLDLWTAGILLGADVLASEYLDNEFADALEGAGLYAAGYLAAKLTARAMGNTADANTGYLPTYQLSSGTPEFTGFSASAYGDTEGFHAE